MEIREQIQSEAVNAWLSNPKSILKIKTGIGKTRIAAKCVIKAIETGLISELDTVCVYAEVSMDKKSRRRKSFIEDFETVNQGKYNVNFEWYTYQSQTFPTGKLIVLDEIDYVGETMIAPFENYKGYVIGLTATMSKVKRENKVSKHKLLTSLWPVVYEYDFNKALDDDLTNEVHVYKLVHKLDNQNKNCQITKSWLGTEQEFWNYWTNKAIEVAETNWEFSLSIKKTKLPRFLYNLNSKIPLAKKFLSLAKKQTICFGKEIEFLEKISNYTIKEYNYQQLVQLFEEKRINHILSSKKIQRGENIKEVENIFLISVGKNSDLIEQLIGRSRLSESRVTQVIMIVTQNTYEERWFDEIFIKRNSSNRIIKKLNYTYKGCITL